MTAKMRFIFLIAIALLLLAAAVVGERQMCKPGSVIKVACNTCVCNSLGTEVACTKKICRDRDYRNIKRYCKPGAHFRIKCNHCVCNRHGTDAVCTHETCMY